MNQAERAVNDYLAAWNETDPARRREALGRLCAPDCQYVDPLAAVSGANGLDDLIAGVQKQMPGLTFSLAGKVDAHHQHARFTWHASPPGVTEPVVIGFDVLVLDDARIRSVYGFLDRVPG